MLKEVVAVVAIVYFAAFGVLSLIWPDKVCDFYRRQYASVLRDSKKWAGASRLTQYKPRASLFRLFGALSLCSSVLLAYAWLKG
jgi:hypothetical protein